MKEQGGAGRCDRTDQSSQTTQLRFELRLRCTMHSDSSSEPPELAALTSLPKNDLKPYKPASCSLAFRASRVPARSAISSTQKLSLTRDRSLPHPDGLGANRAIRARGFATRRPIWISILSSAITVELAVDCVSTAFYGTPLHTLYHPSCTSRPLPKAVSQLFWTFGVEANSGHTDAAAPTLRRRHPLKPPDTAT